MEEDCLGRVAAIRDMAVLSWDAQLSLGLDARWHLGQTKSPGKCSVLPKGSLKTTKIHPNHGADGQQYER